MSIFEGSAVALVTPFTKDGINFSALKRLLDFQLGNGTDALVICGTTGEPATMTLEEKHSVMKYAVDYVAGRKPVILGTGGNNTSSVIAESKYAQSLGADALLIVTPYYNKCSQDGLVKHFFAVADAVELPIIIYNVPSRTGVNITPATLARLAEHPNIQAIKEASGNISQIAEMARLVKGKMDLYSGNDNQDCPHPFSGWKRSHFCVGQCSSSGCARYSAPVIWPVMSRLPVIYSCIIIRSIQLCFPMSTRSLSKQLLI